MDNLYEMLLRNSKEEPVDVTEKTLFINSVRELDVKGINIVSDIIYKFYRDEQSFIDEDIPYKGEEISIGIKMDFNNLPTRLQHMLISFCKMHLEFITKIPQ